MRFFICLFAILTCAHSAICATKPKTLPVIPQGALIQYNVSTEYEILETMKVPRLSLIAPAIRIMMDPLDNHLLKQTEGKSSAHFALKNSTNFKIELFSFPETALEHSINDDTLNGYLEGLAIRHSEEQQFKVIEQSSFTGTGPSKFRILGRRAHHIRYQYIDEGQLIITSESWIKKNDLIHIVRITGQQRTYDKYFENIRLTFTSMAEVE